MTTRDDTIVSRNRHNCKRQFQQDVQNDFDFIRTFHCKAAQILSGWSAAAAICFFAAEKTGIATALPFAPEIPVHVVFPVLSTVFCEICANTFPYVNGFGTPYENPENSKKGLLFLRKVV